MKCQKCTGMGLNGLIFQRINEDWNIKEKKNLGAVLDLPAK